ncbi:hypothetical protein V6N13_115168 [Hibiscus sabdariffa]
MEAGQEDINEGRTNGNDEEKETDDYGDSSYNVDTEVELEYLRGEMWNCDTFHSTEQRQEDNGQDADYLSLDDVGSYQTDSDGEIVYKKSKKFF